MSVALLLGDSVRQVRPTIRSTADRLEAVPPPIEDTCIAVREGLNSDSPEFPHPVPLPEGEGTHDSDVLGVVGVLYGLVYVTSPSGRGRNRLVDFG